MRGLEQIAGHRLLFLNWRDQANPEAGGAEAYTEEIARRLAAAGAEVTLFTGKYPGAAPFDWAREYLVAREGGRFGVYLQCYQAEEGGLQPARGLSPAPRRHAAACRRS